MALGMGLNGVYKYTYVRALQSPDQNITLKLSPVAQTDVRHRQSHRTTCKGRGSLGLAPIKDKDMKRTNGVRAAYDTFLLRALQVAFGYAAIVNTSKEAYP